MGRKGLGEFEHQVLLAIIRLGGEAYSVPLVLELEERSGRDVAQAAVFIVLRRLEGKGLVSSRMEDSADTDTGRARRYFKMTSEGMDQVRAHRRVLERFWEGMDEAMGESNP